MSDSADAPHAFARLTPSFIIDAVESRGLCCDGRILALNSYENRVYQVGLEDSDPVIAKFYRPERWSDAQIAEEHELCFELADQELPVVAPSRASDGVTLSHFNGFRFALYPRRGGRAPEFDNLDNLLILGRLLGRMHLIGASRPFAHRPVIDSRSFGYDSVAFISEYFIPPDLKGAYDSLTHDLLQAVDEVFAVAGSVSHLRLHGDCHAGNILWRDDTPNFVDFDDARMGPAIQDIWMLLSGERPRRIAQLSEILEGYHEFNDFNMRELHLIEALRALRIMHYNAWLARRWDDPAFPRSFPWFNTAQHWGAHVLELREQLATLHEPVLELPG